MDTQLPSATRRWRLAALLAVAVAVVAIAVAVFAFVRDDDPAAAVHGHGMVTSQQMPGRCEQSTDGHQMMWGPSFHHMGVCDD